MYMVLKAISCIHIHKYERIYTIIKAFVYYYHFWRVNYAGITGNGLILWWLGKKYALLNVKCLE